MRRISRHVFLLALALLSTGCAGTLTELVDAMHARQMAHCVFAQGAVPPYGSVLLWGKSGELDCERLWQQRRSQEGP